jgi:hypothetical protein
MVNNAGFSGNLRFFNLTEIIVNSLRKQFSTLHTLLLSTNSGTNFRQLSQKRLPKQPYVNGRQKF